MEVEGGDPQADGHTGLHHVALRSSTRAHLADALRRLQAADWPIRTLIDHGKHEAIYLADPDGNDLELCWDRPPKEWPRTERGPFQDREFDVDGLLAEPDL